MPIARDVAASLLLIAIVVAAGLWQSCADPRGARGQAVREQECDLEQRVERLIAAHPELRGRVLTPDGYSALLEERTRNEVLWRGRRRIEPGETIEITVAGEPDLTRNVVVNVDGWFDYPLIGRIRARGRTTEQIRATVREGIGPHVRDPRVRVRAPWGDIISLGVSIPGMEGGVVGRVGHPYGEISLMGRRLRQELRHAGGPAADAALQEIWVLKYSFFGERRRVVVADMRGWPSDVAPSQDIDVDIYDLIIVPRQWRNEAEHEADWAELMRDLDGNPFDWAAVREKWQSRLTP